MSRTLLIGVAASLLIHGGVFFGGQLLKAKPVPVAVVEETPTIALQPLPPAEPEAPDVADPSAKAPDLSEIALPTQADTPSIIASTFEQQIQPPAPPGARPTGVISIPTGGAPATAGLQNLFDIASLDQRPEARFQPSPTYPPSLRRSGVTGEVVVGFIVDASGDTRDAYIIRSTQSEFEAAVLQVVAKWKFTPGKKSGATVNTRVTISIPFNLEKD